MNFIVTVFVVIFSVNTYTCWVINDLNDVNDRTNETEEYESEEYELTEEDLARLRFSLIYPGTKWCGSGDIAEGYDDLGYKEKEDMCCREHDFCPDTIAAGDTKYNLTNTAFYTRLSCDCDEKFRLCLREANSVSSKTIGLMYFNIIRTQCYRKDYPITGCVMQGGYLNMKCLEYSYDENGEKIHQWFDVPQY